MTRKIKDIEVLKGKTNPHILLIAPHGVAGDDDNTGELARSIHSILDCPAIINEVYRKPKENGENNDAPQETNLKERILNLNFRPDAEMHPTFIQKITENIKKPAGTFVFWLHGILDDNLKDEIEKMGDSDSVKCLIGFGQPDNPSVDDETVVKLIEMLERKKFSAAPTRDEATNYRGADPDNMNQFFKVSQNGLKDVRSIQLEFGYKDIRDPVSLYKTAWTFSNAIIELVDAKPVIKKIAVESDTVLVSKAFEYLRDVFKRHFHDAMLDAGRYLVKEFYADNYQLAAINKMVKKASLNGLIKKLQENSGNAPSKTWIYDAVRLAVDDHFYNNESFRAYGNLGHSQKLRLAYLRDPGSKELLINETSEKNHKDRDLRKRIAEERAKKINGKRSVNIFRAIKKS